MVDIAENTKAVTTLYDQDFYAWTQEQAAKLRAGLLTSLDVANLAEEVESLGKREKKELKNRLIMLLTHLLKWQFKPWRRTSSWAVTIRNQRLKLVDHVQENPSLKAQVGGSLDYAYRIATGEAHKQTRLALTVFPETCPYSPKQIFDLDFWPGGAPDM